LLDAPTAVDPARVTLVGVADGEVGSDQVRAVWDDLAEFWDEAMRSGRTWQERLIAPAVESLLSLRPGEAVLELSCGNGAFARQMTSAGARVVASDLSPRMIELAREHGGDVDYRVIDATDVSAMLDLAQPDGYDAAVSNMAVMDMPAVAPMAEAVHTLVRPGGRFVVSLLHPAFNSGDVTRVVEESDDHRGVVRTHSLRRSTYIRSSTHQGVAVEGQPRVQWYFHRPLQDLVNPFFSHGWVLDGLLEPVLDEAEEGVFAHLPGVIVLRFRRLADSSPGTG